METTFSRAINQMKGQCAEKETGYSRDKIGIFLRIPLLRSLHFIMPCFLPS